MRISRRIARAIVSVALLGATVATGVLLPPTALATPVGLLEADATRPGHVELAWTQVDGATGYTLMRNGTELLTADTLRFDDTSAAFGASYDYDVTADLGGSTVEVGSRSLTVPAQADAGAPSTVTGVSVTSTSDSAVGLSWKGSSDDVKVIAYLVFSGGNRLAFSEGPKSVTVKNLRSATAYTFSIRALDAAGNLSAPGTITTTTSASADTTAPSAPSGVKTTPYASDRIDITWGGASDDHSLAGYLIYRNDQVGPIADVPVALARLYSDTNVAPGITYSYRVQAYDSAGNQSTRSAARSTTPLEPGVVKVVRGPLVQQADRTSAQITWRTNIPALSHLTYTAGGVSHDVTDPVARTQHAVLIGDLPANQTVTYSISYTTSSKPGSFRTCGQPADPSSLSVVGDFGGGGIPEKDIASRIADDHADTIISTGDNVYPAAEDVDYAARFFAPYAGAFAQSPFWTAFGNHEYYDPGASATHVNLTQPANESWFSFDCSSVHVLVLDTEIPFGVNSPQYAFARSDLAAATAPWKIVVLHKPPYSSLRSALAVRSTYQPLFEQFGVQVVFGGHSHNYERSVPINGVTYIVTGGGGNGLNPFTSPQPSWSAFRAVEYHYLQVGVTTTDFSMTARRRDGSILDQATVSRSGDTTSPGTPTGLHTTAVGAQAVSLAWDAATDDVGVTGYRIFRDGNYLAEIGAQTSYTDSGLQQDTSYRYEVRAVDAAKNTSGASDPITVTTTSAGPTLFADDFESGTLAAWTSVNGLTVSQGVPAPSGGQWVARETTACCIATYAYKAISPTVTEAYARFRFQVIGRSGSVDLMRFRNAAGGSKFSLLVDSGTGSLATRNAGGITTKSSAVISSGSWYTVEVHVKIGSPSVTEVWLNGALVPQLSATGDLGSTNFGQFLLGQTGTTGTYDVAFDDVVVSSTFV